MRSADERIQAAIMSAWYAHLSPDPKLSVIERIAAIETATIGQRQEQPPESQQPSERPLSGNSHKQETR
jgi:hypothetical protein